MEILMDVENTGAHVDGFVPHVEEDGQDGDEIGLLFNPDGTVSVSPENIVEALRFEQVPYPSCWDYNSVYDLCRKDNERSDNKLDVTEYSNFCRFHSFGNQHLPNACCSVAINNNLDCVGRESRDQVLPVDDGQYIIVDGQRHLTCALRNGLGCGSVSAVHVEGMTYIDSEEVSHEFTPAFVAVVRLEGRFEFYFATCAHPFATGPLRAGNDTYVYMRNKQAGIVVPPFQENILSINGKNEKDWIFAQFTLDVANGIDMDRFTESGAVFKQHPKVGTPVVLNGRFSHVVGHILSVDLLRNFLIVEWVHGCSKCGDSGALLEQVDENFASLNPRSFLGVLEGNGGNRDENESRNHTSSFSLMKGIMKDFRRKMSPTFGAHFKVSLHAFAYCGFLVQQTV